MGRLLVILLSHILLFRGVGLRTGQTTLGFMERKNLWPCGLPGYGAWSKALARPRWSRRSDWAHASYGVWLDWGMNQLPPFLAWTRASTPASPPSASHVVTPAVVFPPWGYIFHWGSAPAGGIPHREPLLSIPHNPCRFAITLTPPLYACATTPKAGWLGGVYDGTSCPSHAGVQLARWCDWPGACLTV